MARTKQTVRDKWAEKKEQREAGSSKGDGHGDGNSEEGDGKVDDEELPKVVATKEKIEEGKEGTCEEGGEDDDEEGEEEEFLVECILSERVHRRKIQYEVKWVGEDEVTWEPEEHLKDTSALEAWEERKRKMGGAAAAAVLEDDDDDGDDDDDDDDDNDVSRGRGAKRKRTTEKDAEYVDDDDEDDEDDDDDDDDEDGQAQKDDEKDAEYVDDDSDNDEDDDDDDDDEYVPEGRGGFGGRRGPKRRKSSAKPLNDRQVRMVQEDIEGCSAAGVAAAYIRLVKAHPELYSEARELLKGGSGDEDDEDEDDQSGDDD
eukprot:CAMPEP_0174758664 /NCGR_PEP_ID=MMETSP1094-20130205/107879_1 /TAXON_ID=156173 /ORGANISM="Chrysochromulina brevifilum, Strain UTEX LB 985" /LENGTH=314 /DNA_ID=CAMNT_0015964593 /DNA_START=61 /DNA_END=1006 /DNA_ORIENTATION=-